MPNNGAPSANHGSLPAIKWRPQCGALHPTMPHVRSPPASRRAPRRGSLRCPRCRRHGESAACIAAISSLSARISSRSWLPFHPIPSHLALPSPAAPYFPLVAPQRRPRPFQCSVIHPKAPSCLTVPLHPIPAPQTPPQCLPVQLPSSQCPHAPPITPHSVPPPFH